MRQAFVNSLVEMAGRDERIMLLTGDLGFMALEPFSQKYPGRFFNIGVAEQNMLGIATGLAEAGFIPFVYSIATFASLRPYEFIRNGPVLHQLPVRIVGVGGGFEYGHAGPTHFALEDVAVLRAQPGITVIVPADPAQARAAFLESVDVKGPVYFRLGKDDKLQVPGLEGRFAMGRVEMIRPGKGALILAMGPVAAEAVAAAEILSGKGCLCGVGVVSTLQPSPADSLAEALKSYSSVVTVEEHYVAGGLGSLVAEVIAERGLPCRLTRCAVRRTPDGISGSQRFMRARHGLSREAIAETVISVSKELK